MNKWADQIDTITDDFLKAFSGLSEEELNWKPSPDVWSIAENIDHLITLNETYFPVFEQLKKGDFKLPFIARFSFVVTFFGDMILKSVQPDRKKKGKTFAIWEPGKSQFTKHILLEFGAHQDRLKDQILNIEDKIYENAVITSPANNNIVYKLETAIEIIISHEKRHFIQASELCERLKSK